jgi:hypothetical protein
LDCWQYLALDGGEAVAETSERTRAAEEDFTEDPRYAASRREMIISFAYFGLYTFVLIGIAWVILNLQGKGFQALEIARLIEVHRLRGSFDRHPQGSIAASPAEQSHY